MNNAVQFNPTDFEENPYDFFSYLKYKGEPFTGTVVDKRWTCSFKKGQAEGRYVEYFEDGQIAIDATYENGIFKSGKEWHSNGQLKSDDRHLYDRDGSLIRIDECWLYKNGVKRNQESTDGYHTFSSKGELAMKTIVNMTGDYKNTIVYYDSVLASCYKELLINLYPDFDTHFYNLEHYIWGWVIGKYALNHSSGMRILGILEHHQNQQIVRTARILTERIHKDDFNPDKYLNNLGYHSKIE